LLKCLVVDTDRWISVSTVNDSDHARLLVERIGFNENDFILVNQGMK